MSREKNGKRATRIRGATALDPYKRVNVCLPLDSYKHLADIGKKVGIQVGSVARHILTFAVEYEKGDQQTRERLLNTMGLTLPRDSKTADALPMQGKKRGKKASKKRKRPNLVN